jgi:integrase
MVLKRGRKADWASNPKTGEYNEGLYEARYKTGKYKDRIKCYYYKDSKGKHITCGSDYDRAVQKHAIYKREHNIVIASPKIDSLKVTITDEDATKPDEFADSIINSLKNLSNGAVEISDLDITDEFWEISEKVIKANLPYASKRLNIPELGYLHKVKPPAKSITLDEIWNIYVKNYEGRSNRNLNYNIKPHWNEFKKCVGKSSVRDIEFEDITKYNDKVRQDKDRPSVKNQYRYVKNRFDAVKGVIKKAKDKIVFKDDCNELLKHMEQYTYVKKEQEEIMLLQRQNHVLTAKELSKLLKASENDLLVRCSILLGLNCCIRWSDFAKLTKSMLDFRKKEYRSWRGKNAQSQASKLWDETIEALQEYMKENPTDCDNVFLTSHNKIWRYQYLQFRFNKVRKTAKMEWLTQEKLRKITATKSSQIGFGSNTNAYKALMGRKIPGADRSYIYTMPADTEQVINELHKYYFG